MQKKSWWIGLLKYGAGIAVFAFVIISNWEAKPGRPGTGIQDVFDRPVRIGTYLLAGLCCLTSFLASVFRWYLLVRAQNLPFTLRNALRLGLVGYYFNNFLPGSVGGDLIKAAAVAREQERRTVAVSTVLLDRGIGLWALIGLVAISGSIVWLLDPAFFESQPDLRTIVRTAIGVFAATLMVWFSLGFLPERRAHRFAGRLEWFPKVGRILREFWLAVWHYRNRGGAVLAAFGISLISHVSSVLMFFLATLAFQPPGGESAMPGLRDHLIIVPVGMAVQGFFPAPGGLGGGELVFGKLYLLRGFAEGTGVFGSLSQRVLTWVLSAIGFVVYSFMKKELPGIKSAAAVQAPAEGGSKSNSDAPNVTAASA